jgi:excinuclease ABC subunit C
MSTLSEKVLNLPARPGVYLFKDARGEVLYVGKAKSLIHRVRNYLGGDLPDPRLREMMDRAADLDAIVTDTEVEALLLESSLVREHKPDFNVELKDDKSFPFVRISVQEEFPRLSITRQVKDDGARYLGPFTDVKVLRRTLREIRRIFPVRTCRNFEDYRRANRPCLYYHIKRCVGPCTTRAAVDPAEYRALVEGLIWFLTGRDHDLVERLRREMRELADAREFERAAQRRDQIDLLEKARVPQKVVVRGGGDSDVIGVARHTRRAAVTMLMLREGKVVGKETRVLDRVEGISDAEVLQVFLTQHYLSRVDIPRRLAVGLEPADGDLVAEALATRAGHPVDLALPKRGRERKLVSTAERNSALALEDLAARTAGRRARYSEDVLDLQRALSLETPPYRMVCFDISNLGPEGAVAAVVASENGIARKGLYRRMRIRRPGPDDFAMIEEAVERWFAHVEAGEMPRPDLVVVDGGIGQVRAARAALDRASTIATPLVGLAKREEEVVRESGPALRLPRRSLALRALQRLRDEAHRFGLTYHRGLRSRSRVASELDRVPGVGPARRAAMLKEFASVTALSQASVEEIARRARVPLALAARVHDHLASLAAGGTGPPSGIAGDDSDLERRSGT